MIADALASNEHRAEVRSADLALQPDTVKLFAGASVAPVRASTAASVCMLSNADVVAAQLAAQPSARR